MLDDTPCPCGKKKLYRECCGPFHEGRKLPATAEALMRSRYCAYAKGNIEYIAATLHPDRRADWDRKTAEVWAATTVFTGLEVKERKGGGPGDTQGTVTFTARFLNNRREQKMREASLFEKLDGRWYYVGPAE